MINEYSKKVNFELNISSDDVINQPEFVFRTNFFYHSKPDL